MSDEELRAQTEVLRNRLQSGEKEKNVLPDAFALVREASIRTIGLRHFNVQLIGGMVLNNGQIAEMKTGEGKTLVATLALYLKALYGKGAHLITVNDYLASRDAKWMGQVYQFLGFFMFYRNIKSPNLFRQNREESPNLEDFLPSSSDKCAQRFFRLHCFLLFLQSQTKK